MTTVLSEGIHAGEHIVSEANGNFSREVVTVTGADLGPATVLGKIPSATVAAAAKSGGNTGNGTIAMDGTTPALPGVKRGVYAVRFTAATAFTVEDPDGNVIGTGATAAAFADDVKFTITAGGTAFVAGDGFDITVGLVGYAYKKLAPSATDGSQTACAALWDTAKASAADVRQVAHVRSCEVNGLVLDWPTGITTTQKNAAIADLAEAGIIVRS